MADAKRPQGQPTKYKPEYDNIVETMAKKGITIDEIAEAFNVNQDTLYNWKELFASFSEALRRGKDYFDTGMVENALLKRALGFKQKNQKVTSRGQVVEHEETLPPDATSMIFWLKNRNRDRWRDRQEIDLDVKNITVNIKAKEKK